MVKNDMNAEMKRIQESMSKIINSNCSTLAHSENIMNTKMKDLMSTNEVSVQYDTDDCSNQWMSLKMKKIASAFVKEKWIWIYKWSWKWGSCKKWNKKSVIRAALSRLFFSHLVGFE